MKFEFNADDFPEAGESHAERLARSARAETDPRRKAEMLRELEAYAAGGIAETAERIRADHEAGEEELPDNWTDPEVAAEEKARARRAAVPRPTLVTTPPPGAVADPDGKGYHYPEESTKRAQALTRRGDDADFERLMEYRADRFAKLRHARGSAAMLSNELGLWTPFADRDRKDAAIGVVGWLVEEARQLALAEAETLDPMAASREVVEPVLARDISNAAAYAARRIAGAHPTARVATIHASEFNDRGANVIIPLRDGGAWDVATDRPIAPEDLSPMRWTDLGWSIPPPDYELLDKPSPAGDAVRRWFGHGGPLWPILDRFACYMCGTDKAVDMIKGEQDVGKSTAWNTIARAFPGAVERRNGPTVFSTAATKRFTPVQECLGRALVCVVDEIGDIEPAAGGHALKASDLKAICDDTLTIELKGVQIEGVNRLGTAVFMGNEWAAVDTDVKGVHGRVKWAYELDDEVMPNEARLLLETREASNVLRAMAFQLAHRKLANGSLWHVDANRQRDRDRMLESGADEVVAALKEAFEFHRGGAVPSETVLEVVNAVEELKTSALGAKMRKAFGPRCRSSQRVLEPGGGQSQAWTHIRRRTQ